METPRSAVPVPSRAPTVSVSSNGPTATATATATGSTYPSNNNNPTSPVGSSTPTMRLSPSSSPVLQLYKYEYAPSTTPTITTTINSPTHSLRPTHTNTNTQSESPSNAPSGLIFVTRPPIPTFRPTRSPVSPPVTYDHHHQPHPHDAPDHQWTWMEDSVLITTVWILFLVATISCPFISNATKRAICRRRIAQRRWNVQLTNHELELIQVHSEDHHTLQRYDPDDIRFRCSDEEKEDLRKKGLMKKFESYTKKICEHDFRTNDKYEYGYDHDHGDLESCNISLSYHSSMGDDLSSMASTTRSRSSTFLRMASYLSFSDLTKQSESGGGGGSFSRPPVSVGGGPDNDDDMISCDDTSTRTSHTITSTGDEAKNDKDRPQSLSRKDSSLSKLTLSRESTIYSRKRLLMIPKPGVSLPNNDDNDDNDDDNEKDDSPNTNSQAKILQVQKLDYRVVPAECSICLAEFDVGDHISWSTFGHCNHVFHRDCAIQWFLASAKNEDLARQNAGNDDFRHFMDFKSPCPNCRQDFI